MSDTDSGRGTLERAGDRWRLRFVRTLPHPPEKVWRALTEPSHLAAWFPADIEGERVAGGRLRFVFRNGEGPPGEGEMVRFDPPSVMELRWGDELLRFELEPAGDDTAPGCVLTLLDTFEELGKAARDAAGWHTCLDLLALHLAGAEPGWDQMERWGQVHPGYVDRLGPEASTIGPPGASAAPA